MYLQDTRSVCILIILSIRLLGLTLPLPPSYPLRPPQGLTTLLPLQLSTHDDPLYGLSMHNLANSNSFNGDMLSLFRSAAHLGQLYTGW